MSKLRFKVGIDVGNYDTKTQHTSTPSSYKSYEKRNLMLDEYVCYKGMYYSPTNERNNQQVDKTKDNYCLIISLFAVAKEILFQLRQKYPHATDVELQGYIEQIEELSIGVGLPAGYFSQLAESTRNLYLKEWENGFEFEYCGFTFKHKLVTCAVLPQDFTAVAWNDNISTIKDFSKYIIVGIGGGTADAIPVENGTPQVNDCISITKGTTVMFSEIIKTIQHETAKTMEYSVVEAVLLGKPTIVDDARKARIKKLAEEFADKLVDDFIHNGLHFSDNPVVFIGGGALLMRKALEKNPNFVKVEFVEDVNANAKYFAVFCSQ
ncbi:MAG: ParM/StbA family protein [Lachnospiraceae bacterium]|nr:ParM/StbA family protein [Lachnospiraceae bacterium]